MANEASTTSAAPDRQTIRAEIESTRTAYHQLLDSLSDDDWRKKSGNPAWSVGQLMWHVSHGMEFFTQAVEYCRKGKGPNPPSFLIAPGNVLLTKFGSRGATPQSAREKFDQGTEALLACLDGVHDNEWSKSARIYGSDYTIASTFPQVAEHYREHEQDILTGLGRS